MRIPLPGLSGVDCFMAAGSAAGLVLYVGAGLSGDGSVISTAVLSIEFVTRTA
jgi:hypothetical protein